MELVGHGFGRFHGHDIHAAVSDSMKKNRCRWIGDCVITKGQKIGCRALRVADYNSDNAAFLRRQPFARKKAMDVI
jgi:hypothetical protein